MMYGSMEETILRIRIIHYTRKRWHRGGEERRGIAEWICDLNIVL